jgi:polysaccharide biosynthesis/export protein
MRGPLIRSTSAVALCTALCVPAGARQTPAQAQERANGNGIITPSSVTDYVIGAEDVLSIVFWREKELSADVIVRPDGKISLPLLKDVQAAGYTAQQLTVALVSAAAKYVSQPNATVIVKEIKSRKVFVIGQVSKPGAYPLSSNMTVLQAIAMAGDVLEYAKVTRIVIVRNDGSREHRFSFNYKDVLKGTRPEQNIALKSGDTIIVP